MANSSICTCPRGGVVNPGIRYVLLGINTFLLLTGTAMVVLGIRVTQHNKLVSSSPLPDLWWLGLMTPKNQIQTFIFSFISQISPFIFILLPITIGFVGMISTVVGHSKWLLAWAVYSTLTGTASYIFFVRSGCFDPEKFGVTMRIYGLCYQEEDICKCIWSSSAVTMSNRHTCLMIKTTTSIYLSQMILMTLSLAASIIGCFLASVTTCCAKCCVVETEEEQSLLQAGTSTLQDTPTLKRSTVPSCVYMTDYVAPRTTRTYVTNTSASTML